MPTKRLLDRLRASLRALCAATGANVTVTFALATIPMVSFVGAAVDYSQANSVKAAMQAAADSTALMLSKDAPTLNSSQLQSKATDYFKALFNRPEASNALVTVTYSATGGSQVTIGATTDVKTSFMGVVGHKYMKVGVASYVKWGNSRLRVALALDVTGSMSSDGKMTALKTATKGLLTQLKSAAVTNGDVYVSIVPFSKSVNVGKSNHNAYWLKWSGQSDTFDENEGKCKNYDSWSEPKTKSKCLEKDGTWTPMAHDQWNGCVMDRDQDYDVSNAAPDVNVKATLFPAEQYSSCPTQLMPLTYDWDALNAKVDALSPAGMTNQVIGLVWGFQSLTAAPFTIPAKDPNYKYTEVIILVTDGENTQTRFSTSKSTIDARELTACANAKTAGMTIYTVQINTGGDSTQTFLKTCATSADKFIEVKQANQLITTFSTIGTALSNLRVAK
ncbi:MAG: TadE/TadG family protein [Alphaproteobacteria bacterium]|nr:TadE/TadG family protein [Alphaproteobacteria bacterium]